VVLGLITLTVLIVGAAIYCFFSGKGMLLSLWSVFVWLVAPDAGAGETTWAGAIIGAAASVGGLPRL
jgi:hypothetical protein